MNERSKRNLKQVRVAVTGGIGCGKSEVARILQQCGVDVCDTDQLARDLVEPGAPALQKLVSRFGTEILRDDGTLNREAMAKQVFNDCGAREFLESVMHPEIRRQVTAWLEKPREGMGWVAVIIPLLFETGDTAGWDAIICVSAPESIVHERLLRRGYSPEDILARIRAQMELSRKEAGSDYVIINDGTLRDLEQKTELVLATIRKETDDHA